MIALYDATGNHALDQLVDVLVEHDILDPDFDRADRWPAWTDIERYSLGPDPDTPDCGTPDQLPGEEVPLANEPDPDELASDWEPAPDSEPVEPDPDELADYLERQHYEAGCRMRFV